MKPLASLLLALSLALLLAAPAPADEASAEARFHEAYVQEVVEGEVAAAAKTYLQLAGDETAPARIRAEARFRFAVSATLLGRVDEARSWLGALAEDEAAPKAVRERAKTYLEGLSSVGVGTELEKRLQDLLFQLGRADFEGDVPVYRDFEILGAQAVPFLKKLLHHPDAKIRAHAFRILARMDVPGLGAAWHADIWWRSGRNNPLGRELRSYFDDSRHAEEKAALEANLLGIQDDEVLAGALSQIDDSGIAFSLDFTRALARREGVREHALSFHPLTNEPDGAWAQLQEWVEGDDPVLAAAAARRVVEHRWFPPGPYATSLFPPVFRRVLEMPRLFLQNDTWVQAQPPAALLDAMEAALAAAEREEADPALGEALSHLPKLVDALRRLPASDVDLDRLESLFRRWVAVEARRLEAFRQVPGRNAFLPNPLLATLTDLLRALPADRGEDLVTSFVAGFLRGDRSEANRLLTSLPREEGEHARLFLAAFRALDADTAGLTFNTLQTQIRRTDAPSEFRGAFLLLLPELARILSASQLEQLVRYLPEVAAHAPRERALAAVGGLLDRLAGWAPGVRTQIAWWLFHQQTKVTEPAPTFAATLVIPAAEARWETLPADVRGVLLQEAAGMLLGERKGDLLIPEGREALGAFLAAHLDEMPEGAWAGVAAAPDLIPLETWVPKAPPSAWSHAKQASPEQIADAARAFLARLEESAPNDAIVHFMKSWPEEAVRQGCFDRLLRSEEALRHGVAVDHLGTHGEPASVEALGAVLATLLDAESVDLARLGKVTRILALRSPSEALYPAARLLLSSEDPEAVLQGIEIARLLGQIALVKDLVPHLGSMNVAIRSAAKRAVDDIQEIARIQEEAARE